MNVKKIIDDERRNAANKKVLIHVKSKSMPFTVVGFPVMGLSMNDWRIVNENGVNIATVPYNRIWDRLPDSGIWFEDDVISIEIVKKS